MKKPLMISQKDGHHISCPRGRTPRQTLQSPAASKPPPPTASSPQCPDPIQSDIASAIKEALGLVMNRLEALERHSMLPPPLLQAMTAQTEPTAPRVDLPASTPLPPWNQAPVSMNTPEDGAWSTIPHKRKRRKVKEGQLPGMPGAVHLVPGSFLYAMVT